MIQRGDFKYWTGEGFDKILDKAKVYYDHKTAQRACAALQYRQYKGKAVRTFKVEVNITLVADEVEGISQEALTQYLSNALRLDVENSIFGDGPVEGSFVRGKMRLATLKETEAKQKGLLTTATNEKLVRPGDGLTMST